MSAQMGEDKRRSERLEVNFTVTYKVDKPPEIFMMVGGQEVYAVMLDLSEGGMAIVTEYNVPAKSILVIHFTLINTAAPEEERTRHMDIVGEVRYNMPYEREEYRLGIKFTQIARDDKAAIAEFVKSSPK